MKIFVLLSRVPYPLEKGDKLRAYHFIRLLSQKHEIILCAINDDHLHNDALPVLKKYCKEIHILNLPKKSIYWNLLKSLFEGKPLHLGFFWNLPIFSEIQRLVEFHNPDHIFCQLIRISDYIKHIDIPKTIDYQDVFSAGILRRKAISPFWQKPFFTLEYNRLKQYEADIFPFFNNHIIISKPDRDLINHNKNKTIDVIPNGVDTNYFKPQQVVKEFDLLFSGNMNYPPNEICAKLLATKILPELHKHNPNIKLVIAGAHPSHKVMALQSNHVTITGWVEDIRDYYARAKIFIAPLTIGTGLQNKLLEAMAMQIPCITSPLANNALEANANDDILIGQTIQEYVNHILYLLNNPNEAERIAQNGYQFILKNYTWESVGNMIENILER